MKNINGNPKIIYYLISLNKDANSKILNIKIGLFY